MSNYYESGRLRLTINFTHHLRYMSVMSILLFQIILYATESWMLVRQVYGIMFFGLFVHSIAARSSMVAMKIIQRRNIIIRKGC